MATLIKRPDSRFWIACFTSADGRQLKKSTKLTDKSKAMRMALEYESAGRGDMTVRQARTVLSGLMDKKKEMAQMTVREWVTSWVARREAEVSLATFRFYEGTGKKWVKWLGDRADGPLAAQTVSDLLKFRTTLLERSTAESANHRMRGIASMLKSAVQERIIEENPMTFVKGLKPTPEGERVNRQPFTLPQINAILTVCEPEWKSMVQCAAYTGQRLSDIAMLQWEKVDLVGKTVSLKTRKTKRSMQLPLAPSLFDHLSTWSAGRANRNTAYPKELHGFVHPKAAGIVQRNQTTSRLSNEFAEILQNAGVRKAEDVCPRKGTGKGRDNKRKSNALSFHSLRHTATSWMKEAGIPQSVVQEFIGHDDVTMSRLYTHTGDEALRKAAASLPKLK